MAISKMENTTTNLFVGVWTTSYKTSNTASH